MVSLTIREVFYEVSSLEILVLMYLHLELDVNCL